MALAADSALVFNTPEITGPTLLELLPDVTVDLDSSGDTFAVGEERQREMRSDDDTDDDDERFQH